MTQLSSICFWDMDEIKRYTTKYCIIDRMDRRFYPGDVEEISHILSFDLDENRMPTIYIWKMSCARVGVIGNNEVIRVSRISVFFCPVPNQVCVNKRMNQCPFALQKHFAVCNRIWRRLGKLPNQKESVISRMSFCTK